METESSKILSFPKDPVLSWIEAYQQGCLNYLPSGTVAVYISILRQFLQWVIERAMKGEGFQPDHLTTTVIERYLFDLLSQGYSFTHRKRVKSVITHFCQWLVDEQRMLSQNPARGVKLAQSSPSKPTSPCTLSPQVRVILQNLIERVRCGKQGGAEVQPSVVPTLPAQGQGVPAGQWEVFRCSSSEDPSSSSA